MASLITLFTQIIDLFIWLLITQAVLSWLIAFGIVNTSSSFINLIGNFLYKITEPILRPLRNILPDLGGVDITPVIVILLLVFVKNLIYEYTVFNL